MARNRDYQGVNGKHATPTVMSLTPQPRGLALAFPSLAGAFGDPSRRAALADRAMQIYAAVFVGTLVVVTVTTPGLVLPPNGVVGGDFLAFYTAGEMAAAGRALQAYDLAAFNAALQTRAEHAHLGLMWQYPPTMFFLVAPLSLAPYKAAYLVMMAVSWAAFAGALRAVGLRGRALRIAALSPPCVMAFVSGQISLFTGALLILAAFAPKRRWLVAGAAAGVLTLKPQLGLLIPVAYLAVGAWRAIAVAAAVALLVHAPGLIVFGAEGLDAFRVAAERLHADVVGPAINTPPNNMTTLFGQLKRLGVGGDVASLAQAGLAALCAVAVWRFWRRGADALSNAGVLCAAAILAAPYAYGYEMTALALAGAVVARAAADRPEALALMLVAGGAVATGLDTPLHIPFLATLAALGGALFYGGRFYDTATGSADDETPAWPSPIRRFPNRPAPRTPANASPSSSPAPGSPRAAKRKN
ncbi:MAG: glycosyltransferase family 87 protein [Pseudomonadota bacterium]